MKLGLNTWLWAYIFETRHLVCVDTANELGAEALDFSINDPFSFPTAEVKKKLEGSTMEIIVSTAMPANCNAISPVKEEREAKPSIRKHWRKPVHLLICREDLQNQKKKWQNAGFVTYEL